MSEDAKAARKRRLAQALRDNLRRRKAGARPELGEPPAAADLAAPEDPGERRRTEDEG